MLEIHNEKIIDLLDRSLDKNLGPHPVEPTGLDVRCAADGSVSVPQLTRVEVDVSSAGGGGARVDELMRSGAARRHTHATLMNAESSRCKPRHSPATSRRPARPRLSAYNWRGSAHLVLSLHVSVRSEPDGIEWKGRLHLVDLAGSERVEKSGVVGEHLREAQARALAT